MQPKARRVSSLRIPANDNSRNVINSISSLAPIQQAEIEVCDFLLSGFNGIAANDNHMPPEKLAA